MLNHKGTIKIETERLLLRRFVIDDASNMFNNWSSNVQKQYKGMRRIILE